MQTFLPYASFQESADCLDMRRLGKQRVETYQILRTLVGESDGWKNHPCVKMWRGHTQTLKDYGIIICRTWINRGYKDTLLEKITNLETPATDSPLWLGDEDFHLSHKSNLLRKDKAWYGRYWDVPDDLPYIWPVIENENNQ